MQTFDFLVVATGLDHEADDFEDRFFNAGCDDATISFQKGLILLAFDRSAETFATALASAVLNVLEAGATIRRIEPDELVSQADIARRADLTRAAISNYISEARGKDFPLPVAKIGTDSPLWRWSEVADWLCAFGRLEAPEAEKALMIAKVNDLIATGSREDVHCRLRAMAPSPERATPAVG